MIGDDNRGSGTAVPRRRRARVVGETLPSDWLFPQSYGFIIGWGREEVCKALFEGHERLQAPAVKFVVGDLCSGDRGRGAAIGGDDDGGWLERVEVFVILDWGLFWEQSVKDPIWEGISHVVQAVDLGRPQRTVGLIERG